MQVGGAAKKKKNCGSRRKGNVVKGILVVAHLWAVAYHGYGFSMPTFPPTHATDLL